MKFLYKNILKPILYKFSPDFIHTIMVTFGVIIGKIPVARNILKFFYGYKGSDISKVVDGITYNTPILLSAGFDYNADLPEILPSLGFGGEEMGSVTARASKGNPKPQLTRLVKNNSILVNKGLKNDGVDVIIERLKKKKRIGNFVWGISIARTNDEKAGTSIQDGIEDYFYSLRRLVKENIGDYYTINISCPNAFSGETFADSPELLEKLLQKLSTVKTHKPIYVKMPINKPWELIDSLINILLKFNIKGVVIGNLNKDKSLLKYPEELKPEYKGNLSGDTTYELSNNLIMKTKEKYKDKLTIIGVGGIMSAEKAMHKFAIGADLVQLITGMIMEGPHLINEIAKAYEKKYNNN